MDKITKEAIWAKIRIPRTVPIEVQEERAIRLEVRPFAPVTIDDIRSKSREVRVVVARRNFIFEQFDKGLSFEEIGRLINRDRKAVADFVGRRKRLENSQDNSARNEAIIAGVAAGKTYRQVADELGVSVNVVAGQVHTYRGRAVHG